MTAAMKARAQALRLITATPCLCRFSIDGDIVKECAYHRCQRMRAEDAAYDLDQLRRQLPAEPAVSRADAGGGSDE